MATKSVLTLLSESRNIPHLMENVLKHLTSESDLYSLSKVSPSLESWVKEFCYKKYFGKFTIGCYDFDLKNRDQRQVALCYATQLGRIDTVKLLLLLGADINEAIRETGKQKTS